MIIWIEYHIVNCIYSIFIINDILFSIIVVLLPAEHMFDLVPKYCNLEFSLDNLDQLFMEDLIHLVLQIKFNHATSTKYTKDILWFQLDCHISAVIPVTDSNHVLLPLQFSIDPGSQFNWAEDQENPALLSRYCTGVLENKF